MGKAFDIGLRINPEHREGEVEKYDPCQSHSRLGHPISQLRASDLEGVSGLHFHTLCEQDFLPLDRTWRSEEHTSELQSLMRISYAVFCLKKKKNLMRTPNNTSSTRTNKTNTI